MTKFVFRVCAFISPIYSGRNTKYHILRWEFIFTNLWYFAKTQLTLVARPKLGGHEDRKFLRDLQSWKKFSFFSIIRYSTILLVSDIHKNQALKKTCTVFHRKKNNEFSSTWSLLNCLDLVSNKQWIFATCIMK